MASKPQPSTIRDEEVVHFSGMAADWWDPQGSNAMLHRLGPPRLAFLRSAVDAHWGFSRESLRPLAGKRAIDVGCGAGLLTEPLARLGAEVTGVDATPASIDVARAHATASGLAINYVVGGVETLDLPPFDLVTSMEVIEHVEDPALFVAQLARMLAPDGLMILSTPNRTALSRIAMITVGEGLRLIPRGTHDWSRFLKPDELETLLAAHDIGIVQRSGILFSPGRGMVLGEDEAIGYILAAKRK